MDNHDNAFPDLGLHVASLNIMFTTCLLTYNNYNYKCSVSASQLPSSVLILQGLVHSPCIQLRCYCHVHSLSLVHRHSVQVAGRIRPGVLCAATRVQYE